MAGPMPGDALVPAGGVESLLATLAEVRSSAHALLAPRPQPHLQSQMLAASTATKALQRLAATLPDPTPAQTTVLADNTVEIRTLRQQLQGASAWAAGVARQAALLEQEVRTQAEQAFAGEPSAKLLRAGLETWTSKAMDQWLQAEAHRVPDLSLELCSATANTGRIRFRLGQIMHGHLLVRHLSTGLAIEQVVFRGLGEVLETNSPWTPSVHAVFRQISIHATAAALYHTNQHAGDALSLYFHWLHSYRDLFSAPCIGCGSILALEAGSSTMCVPVLRTYRGKVRAPYHERCYTKANC